MRLLPLLTSVVTLVGMAAPAHADSGDDDGAFLAALTRAGITYQNPDRVVAAGKEVCTLASGGKTQIEILRNVLSLNPGFTLDGAAKFTDTAASVYCPDQLTADADSGGSK